MVIQKFKAQSYKIAKDKGFYTDDTPIEKHITGILSELFEAYESHRLGSFTNKDVYNKNWINNPNYLSITWRQLYLKLIKDTFEDEITDLFIRVFNLSSYLKIDLKDVTPYYEHIQDKNIDQQIIHIDQLILQYNDMTPRLWFSVLLNTLYGFCNIYEINLKVHLAAKIEYNKSREYLHGKVY